MVMIIIIINRRPLLPATRSSCSVHLRSVQFRFVPFGRLADEADTKNRHYFCFGARCCGVGRASSQRQRQSQSQLHSDSHSDSDSDSRWQRQQQRRRRRRRLFARRRSQESCRGLSSRARCRSRWLPAEVARGAEHVKRT